MDEGEIEKRLREIEKRLTVWKHADVALANRLCRIDDRVSKIEAVTAEKSAKVPEKQSNAAPLAPLNKQGFSAMAEKLKNIDSSKEALNGIVEYMREQAIYMEHIREHVQTLVNHTSVLTERLVGLQNEVRAAVRGEPSSAAASPVEDKDKQKIH